ncbi:MAG: DUF4314 domain-containing protein [Clostridia bacterium]|nr:DUF4314 domain-containing protein [Clostridia bacterium]
MNDFPSRETVERYKKQYPAGTTVMLDAMPDDPYPVPAGTLGTVEAVDDAGQVHIRWRNGRSLAVIPGHDSFHVIQPDPKVLLQQKIEQCLSERMAVWRTKTPEQLISMADVISAAALTAEYLSKAVNAEQAEYLLHFKDPLEIVSTCWHETHLTDEVFQQEEFSICVANITEGIYDVSDFEPEESPDLQMP